MYIRNDKFLVSQVRETFEDSKVQREELVSSSQRRGGAYEVSQDEWSQYL
jgi:hypothetical protein